MNVIYYDDITDYLVSNSSNNINNIETIFRYKKYNLSNSKFDTRDITDVEINTVKKIQELIGGKFKLIHRIQNDNICTPDCEYINMLLFKTKKYFEIKAPMYCKSINNKNKKISRQIDEAKHQSRNIIISLLRDNCNLNESDATIQMCNCLNNIRYRWIDIIILIGKNNYIKVYKKKRP